MKSKSFLQQLPSVLQTKTMQKFFNSTVDQVFKPGEVDEFHGFIGQKPVYNNPDTDFYKPEISAERRKYQLEPSMTVVGEGNEYSDLLFYEDLVRQLKFQGANTSDHARLFDSEVYSWCPPINIDKFTRPGDYFWLPEGPPVLMYNFGYMDLDDRGSNTNPNWTGYVSNGYSNRFKLPEEIEGLDEDIVIHVNGVPFVNSGDIDGNLDNDIILDGNDMSGEPVDGNLPSNFTISGGYVIFSSMLPKDYLVEIWRYANFAKYIVGQETFNSSIQNYAYYDETINTHHGIEKVRHGPTEIPQQPFLQVGMLLEITDNNGKVLYMVGRDLEGKLTLTEVADGLQYMVSEPDYVTIEVGSENGNPWSRNNRWYHKDVLFYLGKNTKPINGRRPIIEFAKDLELFGYGTKQATKVERIFDDENNRLIDFIGQEFVVSGVPFKDEENYTIEATIFVFNSKNKSEEGKVYTAEIDIETVGEGYSRSVKSSILKTVTPETVSFSDGDAVVQEGAMVTVILKDGEWEIRSSSKTSPRFELYDVFENKISDLDDDFNGCTIIEYAEGDYLDQILDRKIKYNRYGNIVFESTIATDVFTNTATEEEIKGLKFFRHLSSSADRKASVWRPAGYTEQAKDSDGLYEIPLNLSANALNREVEEISVNEWQKHLSKVRTSNNWQLSSETYDLSTGRDILQHRSSLLRTMLLCSDDELSLPAAIDFNAREYIRFKAKFNQLAKKMITSDGDIRSDVLEVLQHMTISKMGEFPFDNTGMVGDNLYIPATASYLGMAPLYEPSMFWENGLLKIRGHDGSLVVGISDDHSYIEVRDRVLYEFEMLVYDSAISSLKSKRVNTFNLDSFVEGRFREGEYSRREFLELSMSAFERWVTTSGYNYRLNDIYDDADPFTWNYSYSVDMYGDQLPGYWRGIYRYYFDTDRPDTHPWEMFGYKKKPDNWDTYYSWTDPTKRQALIDAVIIGKVDPVSGEIDKTYARKDFDKVVPVDDKGDLLDPIAAGITTVNYTNGLNAPWAYGDGSPVETMWINSSSYNFDLALFGYLLKPARFVESNWVIDGDIFAVDQWVNALGFTRTHSNTQEVHNESGKRYLGIQTWISDLIKSKNASISSVLGDRVRNLSANLASKVGGFVDQESISAFAEDSGLLPKEDIHVALYHSPKYDVKSYSGVLVEWSGRGWRVIGYDMLNPRFRVKRIKETGKAISINLGDTIPPVNAWRENTRYDIGIYVRYENSTYMCNRVHTSSRTFEQEYWTPARIDPTYNELIWYTEYYDEYIEYHYGYEFVTLQEITNFISGYERVLLEDGWKFNQIDDNGNIIDFKFSIRELMSWSNRSLDIGEFITLSPGAKDVYFSSPHGTIAKADNKIKGAYSLLDRAGFSISQENFTTNRTDSSITVNSDVGLYGMRVALYEVEHALIFNNITIFNDHIYAPEYNTRQHRLRMVLRLSKEWHGRLNAPGYVVTTNRLVPSFDRQVEDIRYSFDIESSSGRKLTDQAKHQIGYQNREYLKSIMFNDVNQFEFYQGMIRHKGTTNVFDKMIRSSRITGNKAFNFMEEWGFSDERYGGVDTNDVIEFYLEKLDIKQDPQIVQSFILGSDEEPDKLNSVAIPLVQWPEEVSERWITVPNTKYLFDESDSFVRNGHSMISAGYARVNESTMQVHTLEQLNQIIKDDDVDIDLDQFIWVYDVDGKWQMFKTVEYSTEENYMVSYTPYNTVGTDIDFDKPTNFEVGDVLYISLDVKHDSDFLVGTHIVTAVHGNGATVTISTETPDDRMYKDDVGNDPDNPVLEERPFVMKLERRRFTNNNLSLTQAGNLFSYDEMRQADQIAMGIDRNKIKEGEFVYVDTCWELSDQHKLPKEYRRWGVFQKRGDYLHLVRKQPKNLESDRIVEAKLFSDRTEITRNSLTKNPLLMDRVYTFSPIDGIFPEVAMNDIDYVLAIDPANYNGHITDGANQWGYQQVGQRWWDVSKVRYIDSKTNSNLDKSEMSNRLNFHGKVAANTEVVINEWIKSTRRPEGIDYVQAEEWDNQLNKAVEYFYYWRRGGFEVPQGKKLPANSIERILTDPNSENIPYIAPLSQNDLIVSGISGFLTSDSYLSMRVMRSNNEINTHHQWSLIREKDGKSQPSRTMWNKFVYGLNGLDVYRKVLPYSNLPTSDKYGFDLDKGQSIYVDVKAARKDFVETVNNQALGTLVYDGKPKLSSFNVADGKTQNLQWTQDSGSDYVLPIPSNVYWTKMLNKPAPSTSNTLVLNLSAGSQFWSVMDPLGGIVNRWDYQVSSLRELRDTLSSYSDGDLIKVDDDVNIETGGFWTVWKKEGSTAKLFDHQIVNSADVWEAIDWYKENNLPKPPISFPTFLEREVYSNLNPDMDYCIVEDDGLGDWLWTKINEEGMWEVVAKGKGSFRLNNNIFENTGNEIVDVIGDDLFEFDARRFARSVARRDMGLELNKIMNSLKEGIFDGDEMNSLFFDMVNYLHVEQDYLDWCFKTSFLSIQGFSETLGQDYVAFFDVTDSLLDYVQEVKPYHVKVRDFVNMYNLPSEYMKVRVIDFDKPAYYDPTIGKVRTLDPNNPDDVEIMKDGVWRHWYVDYRGRYNLTRHPTITQFYIEYLDMRFEERAYIDVQRYESEYDYEYGWGVIEYSDGHFYDWDNSITTEEYILRYLVMSNYDQLPWDTFLWDTPLVENPRVIARRDDGDTQTEDDLVQDVNLGGDFDNERMLRLEYNSKTYKGLWKPIYMATNDGGPI